MQGPRNEMARDDVWDDSALIRSWDEALDEYKVRACACVCRPISDNLCGKPLPTATLLRTETDWRAQKYHSIHASGGKLEDLPEYVRHHQPKGGKAFRPVRTLPSQTELAQLTRRRRYSQDAKPETNDTHHQSEPVWSSAALTSDQNTPSNQTAQHRREEITTGSTDDATKVSPSH